MRQSTTFLYTLREAPSDAEVVSHKLLAQAGFIQKLSAGLYCYTPAMWRVLKKISDIVRQEMDSAGAQEVMLPILQPREIWDRSKRWDRYVNDGILFHFSDRKNSEVCLGPTHEEVITFLVDKFVSSYKQLPVTLYQIQDKFRDEIRPRFGLMRGREFIMKDAYSFDIDDAGLAKSYDAMAEAYHRIFTRCGLKHTKVDADSGAIGGAASQEFIVIAETGEDVYLICDATGYAANVERAISEITKPSCCGEEPKALETVATPNAKTIEDLVGFFKGISPDRFIKTIIYKATYKDRDEFVGALIRGDYEINEVKLGNKLDCLTLTLASDEEVKELTKAEVGFAGPVGLSPEVKIIADVSIKDLVNAITGANKTDFHYINVNVGRDFKVKDFYDIRLAREGELCLVDDGKSYSIEERRLYQTRGIEVGHIFKLGTKYSTNMEATFTAEAGEEKPFVMGCYGIGISRVAAAAVEQCHDEKGMIWPIEITPWEVHLICVNTKNDQQLKLAEDLYQQLTDEGFEVLFDDRATSAGIKFNDADLIGIPYRIVVGRDAAEGNVEFCERKNTQEKTKISVSEIVNLVRTQRGK